MLSPDGQLALVFNGEIYNYRELRREFEGSYPFADRLGVLLMGFAAWGWEGLLRRIEGEPSHGDSLKTLRRTESGHR